jgi:hypothetical protein
VKVNVGSRVAVGVGMRVRVGVIVGVSVEVGVGYAVGGTMVEEGSGVTVMTMAVTVSGVGVISLLAVVPTQSTISPRR